MTTQSDPIKPPAAPMSSPRCEVCGVVGGMAMNACGHAEGQEPHYAVERERPSADSEWMWACGLCAHTGWSLLSRQGAVREAERHQRDAHDSDLVSAHTRTSTDCGPDFCDECSRAAQEWVRWPCPETLTQTVDKVPQEE